MSIGDKLGPYEILALIGKGGMGEVYKAHDPRLNRDVAIKVLPTALAHDAERLTRFKVEARAASALNHPNVVTIYEINSDNGIHFIAMEYVHGRVLSEIISKGKNISLAETTSCAIQLADALATAHRARIVHRDIKPSNIMLTDEGLIKVLDFGLAKVNVPDPGGLQEIPHTQPGVGMGTVQYMSPEQASGDVVGSHSDVFSAGIVLYEMLSGQRPFRGSSQTELLRAILHAEPPPLQSIAPDVPSEFARIVHQCLQQKPASRYADGAQLARDLRAFQRRLARAGLDDHSTVTIPARGARSRVSGGSRRVRISAVVAVLALGGGIGYWTLGHPPLSAVREGQLSTGISGKALRDARAYLQRYDGKGNIDRAIEVLEPALQMDGQNAGLQAALAEAYMRKYGATSEKQWLQKAVERGHAAVTANDDLAAAHVALGMALGASGRTEEAVHELDRARDLDPLSGSATLALAKIRAGQGQIEEAARLYQRAIDLNPADWIPLADAGAFAYRRARYPEAIAQWNKALSLSPDNMTVMGALAGGYHMNDQYAESANMLQRVLELDPAASTWTNLGTARFFEGRYAEAVSAMEKATQLDPNKYLYWGNLGDAYRWAPGYQEKAPGAYRRAIRLARDALTVNPNDALTESRLGAYLAKSGDATSALAAIEKARQRSPNDPTILCNSAVVYELIGRHDQAFPALERAIQLGYSMHEVANEPEFTSLRSDARYAELLRRHPLATAGKKE